MYIFFSFFVFSQEQKKEDIALPAISKKSSVESFKKQKHRIEIKGHKIYYNENLLKFDTLSNSISQLGKPFYQNPSEFSYDNIPLRIKISSETDRDQNNNLKFEYEGKVYILPNEKDSQFQKVWDLYRKGGFRNVYLKDKDNNYTGKVDSYFIYFRPFEEGRKYPLNDSDPFEKAMKSTPVVDGYIIIDGVPVDKNTTIPDIIRMLKPVVGNNLGKIMGEPVIVYELSEKEMKEIDPNWGSDKAYDRIFISFEMIYDPVTKKSTGLKSIHYYCFM